ncbi:Probable sensory transduction histidine kinase [Pseudooceanicola batsensis HTCC2597]|uniref:histidine kinase n=1 Tax=Pseudooceanicola batsensis (strain ATCC BAA-863 / DSM 15984 / KCTC 12145 / HTCC2597) TaxID=252305 RepID=A3U432_PSEBH|nr:ATP-binding protein [Pseudooceanicola batsensis]EAQ01079.1 Probable sensory transduction histidine kinase [Pseudooceanicola batsensis HTCC2597]
MLSILVAYLMIDVRAKLAQLAASPQDTMQWSLAQFEVEYLAFVVAAEQVAGAPRPSDAKAALPELRRRYDILYARTQTLRDSVMSRPAIAGTDIGEEFSALAPQIFAMADQIDAADTALIAAVPELTPRLARLREPVRRILTFGNHTLAVQADATRQDIASVLTRLAAAVAVLLVTLATMTLLFRREAGVSDRQMRENRATSARLETIFSTSRDAIVVFDPQGRILSMNRAGQQMFGTGGDARQAARIDDLLTSDTDGVAKPVSGRELFGTAAAGLKTGLRLKGLRSDGRAFPVEISVDTAARPGSDICVGVIRDVSRQAAAEDELKQSRDTALAGEKAKARFLGVVSHEMRTPLNGILGTVQLVEDEIERSPEDSSTVRDTYLPVLRNASQSLLSLVDEVLDLTQIEGGVRLAARPFDPGALARDLVLAESARAADNGNEITLRGDRDVGPVIGDPERLRQVLGNLLANAVKFTRDGRISLEMHRAGADIVEFQISDTGFGMSREELDTVFDDFVRTGAAVENQVQGTGLGLGIARTIVEAMGGEIGVESEAGEGSLFWVRLPLPAAALPPCPSESAAGFEAPRGASILLVEDNATNRFIARRMLENDGHTVVEAVDGEDGAEKAMQAGFDMILMDVSMPVMNGISAAQHLRTRPGPNRTTRIVALTAHVSEGLDSERTQSVMDAVLHKPLDRDLLRREIALATGVPMPADGAATPLAASAFYGMDADTALRLSQAFVAETDKTLPRLLDRARAEGRLPDAALAEELHALAGAAASLGISRLHERLIRAEAAERHGDTAETIRLTSDLSADWPRQRALLLSAGRSGTDRATSPQEA